jgi:hypothetical protein
MVSEPRRNAVSTLVEPERRVEVLGEYEVVVLGGGPAGIAAAVAAAQAGRTTILIERYGFLGGMGTAAGVTNFCGLHASVHGEMRTVVHGVADALLDRIDRLGGLNAPHKVMNRILAQAYDVSAYKAAADDLLLSHEVHLLFHAIGAGVVMAADGVVDALLVETKSGRRAIRGRVFVDASGDGDLAAWAGAPFEKGDGRGNLLFPSMMFRVNGVDPARAGDIWREIDRLMQEAEARGEFRFPRKGAVLRPQKRAIEWRVNITQQRNPDGSAVDGTDAASLSHGEIEGRRQAFEILRFLRTLPGFADCYIVEIGPQVGIRETRRIVGDYQLSESDVLDAASFADTVGVNGWPVEAHLDGAVVYRWHSDPKGRGFNHLPYRMILPKGVDNLLVAGRCASMTHEGQSAARVTGACFVMGQAAGTAAALALDRAVAPRDLAVAQLQRRLEADGAYLGTQW